MARRLSPEEEGSALEIRDMLREQGRLEKEPEFKPDQKNSSLSLKERLFRTLEEITTPKGT